MKKIYLDYMATTPVDERVVLVMNQFLDHSGCFGNPASTSHDYGLAARDAVEKARGQVANLIGARPNEIIWTSGATEADNLAIKGVYDFYQDQGRHIVTVATEHKAVLDTCSVLENEGASLSYIQPYSNGLIDIKLLEKAIKPETILVSIMHVNNEIGVIQDLASIGHYLRAKGILFHVDAAQSAGKVPIDVQAMKIDLMSLSAHKIYGPKGIGALYIRSKPRVRLKPLSYGGGHELGLRSGTLPTHQIAGMGEAFHIAKQCLSEEQATIKRKAGKIISCLSEIPGVCFNGDLNKRYPGNINFRVEGVNGESLRFALLPLALSSTSACASEKDQPSYVLKALGLSDREAADSMRLSIGRFTTDEDIDLICEHLNQAILPLYHLSSRSASI